MTSRNFAFAMMCCMVCVAINARGETSQPIWQPCNEGVCKIAVTVDAAVQPCKASVDKPYVSIETSKNLQWTIVTPDYSFAENGIVFEDPQFEPKQTPGADKFIVHDKFTSSGDFKYAVNVQGCETLDPYVRN